jgi:hypothetical protein
MRAASKSKKRQQNVRRSNEETDEFKRTWLNVDYDGIRGNPPIWFPASVKSDFVRIRFRLWKNVWHGDFAYEQIRLLAGL